MFFDEEAWLDDEAGRQLDKSLFQGDDEKIENTTALYNTTSTTTVCKKKARKRKKPQRSQAEVSSNLAKKPVPSSEEASETKQVHKPKNEFCSMANNKKPKKKKTPSSLKRKREELENDTKPSIAQESVPPDKNRWKKNKLAKLMGESSTHISINGGGNDISNNRKNKAEKELKAVSVSKNCLSSPEVSVMTPSSRSSELTNVVTTKLQSAQFRFINEQLYTRDSRDAKNLFANDPKSFAAYHKGFIQQVSKWPTNPLDIIIGFLKKRSPQWIVGDFGCGDARLAASVKNKVHSFDLVAVNKRVTVADISNVPLPDKSLDAAVFCLSLMGTNYLDFLAEANRTLKHRGLLLVAEVASRFKSVPKFLVVMKKLGFELKRQDRRNSHFLMFDFIKTKTAQPDIRKPVGLLKPCVYKKR